jgi:AcrR family transcriptional regulator
MAKAGVATADRILEASLDEAEAHGFADLRLHVVADRLGLSLAEVRAHYRDADAIADAWFGRALDAMLQPMPEGFAAWPAAERLSLVIERWLGALTPRRRLTGRMLRAKLWPSHPHHWVPLAFDLSRLVHWMLDAARIEGRGPIRALEEIGTTALVLATLRDWLRDTSPDSTRTRQRLRRRLAAADRAMAGFTRRRPGSRAA